MDAETLQQRIQEALAAHAGEVQVLAVEPLAGGACQDNLAVAARLDGAERRLVLRSDAATSLPGSLDRAQELRVIQAAVAAGVTTPAARWPCPDLLAPGAQAYFMDWADGVALGGRVVKHPSLARAREGLVPRLAQELARIHSVTPAGHPDLFAGGVPADPVAAALTSLEDQVRALPRPHPALELVLRWLARERPAAADPVLVHADFRTGNFLVAPDGLAAVLDWEFAHWGHPAEDVGWLCVRDWRFGQLERPAGGLGTREELLAAYAEAAGRELDPAEVRWWEVYGNARWAAGCVHQGERYLSGEQPDLELVAIARRACEMEYEALRLTGAVAAAPPPARPPQPSFPAALDRPPAAVLQEAVGGFLAGQARDALKAADPGLAFRALIAANLLGVVGREVALGDALAAARRERLAALGHAGELEAAEAAFAERVRAGALDDDPAGRDHVVATLREQLAVANPRFDLRADVE